MSAGDPTLEKRNGSLLKDGQYRIDSLVGSSWQGTVYTATDLTNNRQVAIKQINFRSFRNLTNILSELQGLVALENENIVPLLDFFIEDGSEIAPDADPIQTMVHQQQQPDLHYSNPYSRYPTDSPISPSPSPSQQRQQQQQQQHQPPVWSPVQNNYFVFYVMELCIKGSLKSAVLSRIAMEPDSIIDSDGDDSDSDNIDAGEKTIHRKARINNNNNNNNNLLQKGFAAAAATHEENKRNRIRRSVSQPVDFPILRDSTNNTNYNDNSDVYCSDRSTVKHQHDRDSDELNDDSNRDLQQQVLDSYRENSSTTLDYRHSPTATTTSTDELEYSKRAISLAREETDSPFCINLAFAFPPAYVEGDPDAESSNCSSLTTNSNETANSDRVSSSSTESAITLSFASSADSKMSNTSALQQHISVPDLSIRLSDDEANTSISLLTPALAPDSSPLPNTTTTTTTTTAAEAEATIATTTTAAAKKQCSFSEKTLEILTSGVLPPSTPSPTMASSTTISPTTPTTPTLTAVGGVAVAASTSDNIRHRTTSSLAQAIAHRRASIIYPPVWPARRDRRLYFKKREIVNWLEQSLKGLSFIHSKHYVHSDIRPETLLLAADGSLKIGNLGFARHLNHHHDPNFFDRISTYSAPELIHQHATPTGLTDVWSLGITFAQIMLLDMNIGTWDLMFDAEKLREVCESIKRVYSSPSLSSIIAKCLVVDPYERATSQYLLERLQEQQQEIVGKDILPVSQRDRYTYVKRLGAGSQGVVYLFKDLRTNELVAIKRCIHTKADSDNETHDPFSEIKMISTIKNDNIVNFRDVFLSNIGGTQCFVYLVMDYCAGGDLHTYIRHRAKKAPDSHLDEKIITEWITSICEGLQYLHQQHIIHRDLKPQNIFFTEDRKKIKIGDFGLSKELTANTCSICGTPNYLPPEMYSEETYGFAVDTWSLGCIIYELLTLKKFNVGMKIIRSPSFLKELCYELINQNLTQKLVHLMEACLQVEPTHRPSIDEILLFLNDNTRVEFSQQFWLNKITTPTSTIESSSTTLFNKPSIASTATATAKQTSTAAAAFAAAVAVASGGVAATTTTHAAAAGNRGVSTPKSGVGTLMGALSKSFKAKSKSLDALAPSSDDCGVVNVDVNSNSRRIMQQLPLQQLLQQHQQVTEEMKQQTRRRQSLAKHSGMVADAAATGKKVGYRKKIYECLHQ